MRARIKVGSAGDRLDKLGPQRRFHVREKSRSAFRRAGHLGQSARHAATDTPRTRSRAHRNSALRRQDSDLGLRLIWPDRAARIGCRQKCCQRRRDRRCGQHLLRKIGRHLKILRLERLGAHRHPVKVLAVAVVLQILLGHRHQRLALLGKRANALLRRARIDDAIATEHVVAAARSRHDQRQAGLVHGDKLAGLFDAILRLVRQIENVLIRLQAKLRCRALDRRPNRCWELSRRGRWVSGYRGGRTAQRSGDIRSSSIGGVLGPYQAICQRINLAKLHRQTTLLDHLRPALRGFAPQILRQWRLARIKHTDRKLIHHLIRRLAPRAINLG